MAFNILKMILPPDDKIFYEYFEESTKICNEAAKLFKDIISGDFTEDKLIDARSLKHRSTQLSTLTLKQLNATFITPIDREDIQLVACLLNRITKKISKACFNLRVYRVEEYTANMKRQSETLVVATEELIFNVSNLRNISDSKSIIASHKKMKEIETHGDEILHDAMDELFSGKYDALTVIKLRDIYKDIENALDTCFDVSDSIVNVALKHG